MSFIEIINSLEGNEKIKGINPKLMKDILANRYLLDQYGDDMGIMRFIKAIGSRRFGVLLNSDLFCGVGLNNFENESSSPIYKTTIVTYRQHPLETIINDFQNNIGTTYDGQDGFLGLDVSIERVK